MAAGKFRILTMLAAFASVISIIHTAAAQDKDKVSCAPQDKTCLFSMLDKSSAEIANPDWRDQTLREYAKLLARDKRGMEAVALISRIAKPDTKAMTIRGIGAQAAKTDMKPEEFTSLFTALRAEADKIDHPPSFEIALTYIATAQANARLDTDAMKTVSNMKNDDMRNKAYKELAKIQAYRNDLPAALVSCAAIGKPATRDLAHYTIAKIFASAGKPDLAQQAALKIENPYQRSQAMLHILGAQITPEEKQITPDDAIGVE